MSKMLREKVCVVTGAGRGIGREIALLMAREGAAVVVNDLGGSESGVGADSAPAQEVVNEIEQAGGQAVAHFGSVSEWDSAHDIVETAVKEFGQIDCVVNNAGILRDVIFHKMTEADWDSVISVHLKGSFNIARAAATHFRQQIGGSMVHMTSTSGLIGNRGQANYAAAKLGIVGLSKSVALDMERFEVRSNCIAPFAWSRLVGTIPTNDPAQAERVNKFKEITPAYVAPLAAFLASDEAKPVTGQVFSVRKNEIYLMSQPRPIRTVHRSDGWTPRAVAEHLLPAFAPSFFPLDRTADVINWDPI